MAEAGAEADALIVQWAPVDAAALARMPHLRFISRLGIGYDMIDVDAASARGVAVANTPDYCVEEVVAHTLALVLAGVRGVVAADRQVRAGGWAATELAPPARRPSTLTLGVLGLGRIGSIVAAQAARSASGCSPTIPPSRATAWRWTSCSPRPTCSRCTCR